MRVALGMLLACTALGSCTPRSHTGTWAALHEVTPPFLLARDGTDPNLACDASGRVALTWVTRDTSGGADLWVSVSRDSGAHFTAPVRVNPDAGRVSSFSESRAVPAWGRDGQLLVAWTASRGEPMADDIAVRTSPDGGRAWGSVQLVNDDRADAASRYHGFIALETTPDNHAIVAWIDGRETRLAPGEDEPHVASIRAARSTDGGATWSADIRVAGDVCPCCRPALRVLDDDGARSLAVAYRGARDDLRDPRLAFSFDGGVSFTVDTLVSRDRWWMPGCPVVGLALTANRAGGGHVAWFTGESPQDSLLGERPAPGVYVTPWRMGSGAAGPKRALADSLDRVTRPQLAPLGSATLIGVLGRTRGADARGVLALRVLELDGTLTPWLFLGSGVRAAALAGGPASAGTPARAAWVAWVEADGESPRVRVARLTRE